MEIKSDRINVSVRIRPLLNQQSPGTCSSSLQIISKDPPVLAVTDKPQTYHFDNIFPEDADQEKVFNDAVKPFVDFVKKGYNCTVFAYGQTGTGKTYTMGSAYQDPHNQSNLGIIPRSLNHLFNDQQLSSDESVDIYISFAEIYNEKVFDLMQPDKLAPLPVSGFAVQGLSLKRVLSVTEANELLDLGNKRRHVGETKQNVNSSRSHAIFTVYYSQKNSSQEISGKLNLVDLAGSEGVKKTGSKGSTLLEGININKGLLSIGLVISALAKKSAYVPYRQSMITSILQGSLNVDNYISLIACVSSSPTDITETLQTLDFAQRTKKVRSNSEVAQVVARFKKDNPLPSSLARTPMKRPSTTSVKTPAVKRNAVFSTLPMINESVQSQLSEKSHFSSMNFSHLSSISAAAGCVSVTQQSFSPVIKKYVKQMEESIIDRLETVIKNTIKRPTRTSIQAETFGKENTPNSHWNKIQNEVSKLVRNELAQLSSVKTVRSVRAASSPIHGEEINAARRILTYDSPETFQPLASTSPVQNSIADVPKFSFKIPTLPQSKNKREISANISSISPIESESLPPVRRSIRLSMKIPSKDSILENNNNSTLAGAKSKRKARVKKTKIDGDTTSICENDFDETMSRIQDVSELNMEARRRSVRSMKKEKVAYCESPINVRTKRKSIGFNVAKTPAKSLTEKLKKHTRKENDSPFTAHSKNVLRILNTGTQKEIEKLHSVGVKTAERMLLFRKLKGGFNELEDLSKIPGWGAKKCERFFVSNMLRRD
ncbi:kinesin-like protein Nod [Anthonomus grandis grandis]|uniref:kinesin-like protein Nod n=1 Tax=Anthonomus grandis grandis TaxID=2921223 RepID=UPI002165F8D7|nr:kinesin-like protein Nod [Anthonomus grandis grandis]